MTQLTIEKSNDRIKIELTLNEPIKLLVYR